MRRDEEAKAEEFEVIDSPAGPTAGKSLADLEQKSQDKQRRFLPERDPTTITAEGASLPATQGCCRKPCELSCDEPKLPYVKDLETKHMGDLNRETNQDYQPLREAEA